MKKSEMEKLLLDGLRDLGQWYHLPPEGVARALRLLLEPKEGWEPEDPELPKRLIVIEIDRAGLSDNPPYRFLVPADRAFESHADQRLAYDAAAEAYSRIQKAGGAEETVVVNKHLYDQLCKRAANVQRCADRSDQLVDRWKGVVERALAEVRRPATSFERILAILEEREPETEAPTRPGDVISKTRQGVTVHYAIGPVRETREEAEQDLRLFQEH